MAAKTNTVSFAGQDLDIEALIAEGIEKNRQVNEQADDHAVQVVQATDDLAQQDNLDVTLQRIDMFKFQDQDFREVRRNFQQLMHERLQ